MNHDADGDNIAGDDSVVMTIVMMVIMPIMKI